MHSKVLHLFASSCALSAIFLTTLICSRCAPGEKWFVVTFIPLIIGFVVSYIWGRAVVKEADRVRAYGIITTVAAILFVMLDIVAIFKIGGDNRILLVALTASMFQGMFITYMAGRASIHSATIMDVY